MTNELNYRNGGLRKGLTLFALTVTATAVWGNGALLLATLACGYLMIERLWGRLLSWLAALIDGAASQARP